LFIVAIWFVRYDYVFSASSGDLLIKYVNGSILWDIPGDPGISRDILVDPGIFWDIPGYPIISPFLSFSSCLPIERAT